MGTTLDDPTLGGISLERYAAICADLRRVGAGERADVVTGAGLSVPAWEAADRQWKEAIEADFDEADGLLVAFAARFTAAQRALVATPAPGAVTAGAETPLGPPPSVRAPSYLAAPAPEPAPVPRSVFAGTIDVDLRAIPGLAVPFGPAPIGASAGLPLAPSPGPRAPALTIEQYASLAAELEVSPESSADVCARYLVMDKQALQEANRTWEARFVAEPGLRDRWTALVAEYRTWLLRKR